MSPRYFLIEYNERLGKVEFTPVYDEDGYIQPIRPNGKVLGCVPA